MADNKKETYKWEKPVGAPKKWSDPDYPVLLPADPDSTMGVVFQLRWSLHPEVVRFLKQNIVDTIQECKELREQESKKHVQDQRDGWLGMRLPLILYQLLELQYPDRAWLDDPAVRNKLWNQYPQFRCTNYKHFK